MLRSLSSSGSTSDQSRHGSIRRRKFLAPLCILSTIWAVLTFAVYIIAITTQVPLHYYLLVGSIVSLLSGSFMLFAGYMSSEDHRSVSDYNITSSLMHYQTFSLIYSLTCCYMMLTMKFFLTAVMVYACRYTRC